MSWRETQPGHFERPLDSIELFYKTVTDGFIPANPNREHWTVTVSARLKFLSPTIDVEAALRHAWKTIRYDHPDIASIAYDGNKIYEVPNTAALEQWLAKTFIVTHVQTADEILASAPPSPQPNLYYLPITSQILIRSSHWRIDGIGALYLLNNLLTTLATPREIVFGGEWQNLLPSLDEAAAFPAQPSEEENEAGSKLFSSFAENLPSIALPITSHQDTAGATHRSTHTLSQDKTSILVKTCRKRNLSITTVLHAALILATAKLSPPTSSNQKYTSFGTFNLRPYLPYPYNTPAHPVSLYSIGLPLSLPPTTLKHLVAQLQPYYRQFPSPTSQSATLPTHLGSYIQAATSAVQQYPPPSTPGPAAPVLISLGKIDDYIQHTYGDAIEITEFFLATEVLTRQLTFYVWTWREEMIFSVCYNSHFYTKDYVGDFIEEVKSVLFDELGVEKD